jgi:hypothetical protein
MSSLKEKSLESGGAAKKIRITLTSTDVKALEKGELRAARGRVPKELCHDVPRVARSVIGARAVRKGEV